MRAFRIMHQLIGWRRVHGDAQKGVAKHVRAREEWVAERAERHLEWCLQSHDGRLSV